jgi:hypothetical protein
MSEEYVLCLDASSSTVGIALFQDMGDHGDLKLLHHVTPKIRPVPPTKTEELFKKVILFEEEFLNKYKNFGIKTVIIEEALMNSNNIYTVATLLKFNGMISKSVYDTLGVVPQYISSYDARKFGFPELMVKRKFKKDGTALSEKAIEKNEAVLFGGFDFEVDKKTVIWNLVADRFPAVEWAYDKNNKLIKQSFDLSDSACLGLSYFNQRNLGLMK